MRQLEELFEGRVTVAVEVWMDAEGSGVDGATELAQLRLRGVLWG